MEIGVVAGVVLIGFVHGVLPDHGWPIAATYALNRRRRWLYGVVAALVLGIGHLLSSVALVVAYVWFGAFAEFAEGPWMRYVAGVLLILLGVHEYRRGGHGDHSHHRHEPERAHRDERGHDRHSHHDHHGHDCHEHGPQNHHVHADGADTGVLARVRSALPGGGHHHLSEEHAERGLAALGTTALLLGFAHEEPVQILAICGGAGTDRCLELMLVYSFAVIVAIVLPTLLLLAGYERHRDRIERYTPYLPTVTAIILVGMGAAFIVGLI
ncbi:ABC transporter permease [Halosolutus gelatinilyticus]|uniref:ABC transporter permease n=1 Tax=Halosolutus gelatinilyticus TaxID=2931975 RepID=UPI001FF13201|nr:ABC transporter permease [Halosolutus gelatinilyticus]